MSICELLPLPEQRQKSFYGKAKVIIKNNGDKVLYSYDTPIATLTAAGKIIRMWGGWSNTTGRHIKAFCGLDKKQFMELPHEITPAEKAAAYNGVLFR